MRKWLWVIVGLFAVGATGHYFAEHDPSNPFLSLPPDQIIAQGRDLAKRWAESNTPGHKSLILIKKDEDAYSRAALKKIPSGAPQYHEAQRLLGELQHQEDVGKREMQATIAKHMADDTEGRKAFAQRLETGFLKSGMDVTLTTTGAKATTLNFRYVLLTRPFLYKLANESEFLQNCKHAGFTRVHFTDGYNASSNYDLTKGKFE